jgi:hypothetical protein
MIWVKTVKLYAFGAYDPEILTDSSAKMSRID